MEEIKKELTRTEIMDVIQMASQIYSSRTYNAFNPYSSNSILKGLNNDSKVPTKKELNNSLINYVNSESQLKGFSEFAESFDKLYARALDLYTEILSFDLDIVCKNAYRGELDYQSSEFKDDKKRVYKFLDNFDYKSEFKKVSKNVLRSEIYYTWFRDSKGYIDETPIDIEEEPIQKIKKTSKYALQMMPQHICFLTAVSNEGLLYDMDMSYFINPTIDLNSYAPIIRKYMDEIYEYDKDKKEYIPSAKLDKRNGTYSTITQTSPEDGAWAWKFDMSNMVARPFLSSVIKYCLTNDEIFNLQNDINMKTAHGILVGEIQLMTNNAGGNAEDNLALDPATFMKFMKLVIMGMSANIDAVGMPTKDPKLFQFENKSPDMYDNQLKVSSGNLASSNRLIYSSDKMSLAELENAIYTDYNIMSKMYSQFNKFMNFYINKKTKKYKFDFIFSGCSYPLARDKANKNLLDLADRGIILNTSAYAKVVNMPPHSFERSLEEGKYSGWTENLLSQLLSIHTQSKDAGAPEKTDLKDGGAVAREYS